MCKEILCDNKMLLCFIQGFADSRSKFSEDAEEWAFIRDSIKKHFEEQKQNEPK